MKIDDLKVLVTGARGDLNSSIVLSLARDGADVAFRAGSTDERSSIETAAVGLPGKVRGFVTSTAPSEDEITALVKDSAAALGGLNGLVNSDQIAWTGSLVKRGRTSGAVEKLSLARWQQVIDVNQTATFLYTREFAAHCMETATRPACVVTLCSVSRRDHGDQTINSAAAAAVIAMTATWAIELAPHGIRSGAVAAGHITTAFLRKIEPEVVARLVEPVPLKRLGELEEVYLAVKFIFENDYVTGTCIDVTGGLRL